MNSTTNIKSCTTDKIFSFNWYIANFLFAIKQLYRTSLITCCFPNQVGLVPSDKVIVHQKNQKKKKTIIL